MDDQAQRTLEGVLNEARDLGFLGPGAIEPHITNAHGFVQALPREPRRFLDLGAGGGLPGLALALEAPAASGALLDASKRRTDFLARAVGELGLATRIDVICERAETAARREDLRGQFDLVVARSFGAPAVTAECAVAFLEPGGALIVSEPPVPDDERWPEAGLARLGLAVEAAIATDYGHFVVLTLESVAAEQWPRRVGIPTKRPLWT